MIVRGLASATALTLVLIGPTLAAVDWVAPAPGAPSARVLALWVVAVAFAGWPAIRRPARGAGMAASLVGARSGRRGAVAALAVSLPLPFLAVALGVQGLDALGGHASRLWALGLGVLVVAVLARAVLPRTLHAAIFLGVVLVAAAGVAPLGSRSATATQASLEGIRFQRASFHLAGPLTGALVTGSAGIPTSISAELVAGERRTALGWLAVREGVDDRVTSRFDVLEVAPVDDRGAPHGETRVRALVLAPEGAGASSSGLEAASQLAGRAAPTLVAPAGRLPWDALLLAWTVALAQLSIAGALARRLAAGAASSRARVLLGIGAPVAIVLLGASGALGAGLLAGDARDGEMAALPAHVRVLEGERAGASQPYSWLQRDCFRGTVALAAELEGMLRVDGGAAARRLVLEVGSEGSSVTVEPSRVGAPVEFLRWLDPGFRLLRREVNTWGRCEAAWTRDPSGVWAGHGAWDLGDPLPAAEAAPVEPLPLWCGRGLPMGRPVLVLRLAEGTWAGATGPGRSPYRDPGSSHQTTAGAPDAVWVRLVGF